MSEKVTFRELVESIAEETQHSEQFTHDFLKNFVDVINDGLKTDGKVNIAGLGKFDLRHMDEREGYNPQTEEKMTIPAHNKLVFKPYKEVRERVNAPYAHLEPELIEKDDETNKDVSSKENTQQGKKIPTGLPTPRNLEQSSEEETVDPFDFAEKENTPSSNFSLDDETEEQANYKDDAEEDKDFEEDIVEFRRDSSNDSEKKEDVELNEFMGTGEPFHKKEGTENLKGQNELNDHDQKKNSSFPVLTAVAAALLLAAIGAWYFTSFPQDAPPKITAELNVSTSSSQIADQEGTKPAVSGKSNQSASAQQSSQQSKQTSQQQISQSAQATNQKEENLAIERGQTLWSIAEEKYGNPRLWPWIYDNNGSVENPDLIIAGNSLSLPLPSGPQNSLTSGDSVGVAKGYLSTYQWYKDKHSLKAKEHLWGARHYHEEVQNIADVQIDEADLSYAKKAR